MLAARNLHIWHPLMMDGITYALDKALNMTGWLRWLSLRREANQSVQWRPVPVRL